MQCAYFDERNMLRISGSGCTNRYYLLVHGNWSRQTDAMTIYSAWLFANALSYRLDRLDRNDRIALLRCERSPVKLIDYHFVRSTGSEPYDVAVFNVDELNAFQQMNQLYRFDVKILTNALLKWKQMKNWKWKIRRRLASFASTKSIVEKGAWPSLF